MIFQEKWLSYHILLTDQLSWFHCFYILNIYVNTNIAIVHELGYDLIDFEMNLILLIMPFLCMTKKKKKDITEK